MSHGNSSTSRLRARVLAPLAACAAALALAAACATKGPELVDSPSPNAIKAAAAGFSPSGDSASRSIKLNLYFGDPSVPQLWSVEIATGSVIVKRFEGGGSGSELPASVEWDGKTDGGATWPEGEYYAILNVKYDEKYYPSKVAWDKFRLVSSPPLVGMKADPPFFTPEGGGMAGPVNIKIEASSSLASVAAWSIAVRDEAGRTVRSFEGKGPNGASSWDGSIEPEGFAEPSKTYTAYAEARDTYGNVGKATLPIAVKEPSAPAEASLIETEERGFSPTSGKKGGIISFSMRVGNVESLRSWKVDIVGSGIIRKTFGGDGGPVPSSLEWDGRDDMGALSPEGSYAALLAVDYGRTFKAAQSRTKDFVLATTPPSCALNASPSSFTPSDKGVASPVALLLNASSKLAKIDSWNLDIVDAQGRSVRGFDQKWPANQVLWDGQTSAKDWVETGAKYLAKATVVDEFGNKASVQTEVGVKDIPSPTEPSIIEPKVSGFSPQGQGKPRSVDFIVVAGNAEQMKSWKVAISHAERGTQRVFSGTAAELKRSLSWDGTTDSGTAAPDGSYYAVLSVDYGKSFKAATAKSPAFALQAAPPDVELSLSPAKLTPKAGDFESPIDIELGAKARFAEIESWIVSILDPNGKTVALFKDATPGASLSWNGRTNSGGLAEPSMTYTVAAEVRDSYGNTGYAKALIPVDELPPVPGESAVAPESGGFSPDGDGVMDSIALDLVVPNKTVVKTWKVDIAGADGAVVRTFSGSGSTLKDAITWTGRDDAGNPTPEGSYTAQMSIDYGSIYKSVSVKSRKFVLDATPPVAKVRVLSDALVPDEGGLVSPAAIELDGSSASARMASWSATITDSSGRSFGAYEGAWPPKRISWNGVADDGSLVQAGSSYVLAAVVTDEFGLSSKTTTSLLVGALPQATEPSSVAALAKGFSPAVGGSIQFALGFGNKNLAKAWSLDIERDDRSVRMHFAGDPASLPERFSWDGKLQDGSLAPDGLYLAKLSIDYGRVYAPASVSSEAFALVASPPIGHIAVEPGLFSPDGAGGPNDNLTITLEAASRYAKINDWSIVVSDPGGNEFASFQGQGPVKPIVWNGRNAKGELVESAEDYPIAARVRDEFGNVLELSSAVHVDILIVKMGDGYRIRIASIVFKPYTADFLDLAPDIAARNLSTLNLLADKLKKFPGYQIKLVGHAVMVNWDNPTLGKKEQEKELLPLSKQRADAIMQALAQRGIEAARMSTDGVGAADQIVPDSDLANRWKNRRVEFFLQKKK